MSTNIATRDGGKTWTANKAAPLFTVRGSATAPLWSPDGARIAITNKRGDHSYVALYALGATNVVFAQPGFSNDADPVWSPDGSHIAFVRLPGVVSTQSAEYDDPSLFPAWSIVVADAATGNGATVWRSLPGRGHEFTIADGTQPLFWSAGGCRQGHRFALTLKDRPPAAVLLYDECAAEGGNLAPLAQRHRSYARNANALLRRIELQSAIAVREFQLLPASRGLKAWISRRFTALRPAKERLYRKVETVQHASWHSRYTAAQRASPLRRSVNSAYCCLVVIRICRDFQQSRRCSSSAL